MRLMRQDVISSVTGSTIAAIQKREVLNFAVAPMISCADLITKIPPASEPSGMKIGVPTTSASGRFPGKRTESVLTFSPERTVVISSESACCMSSGLIPKIES